MASDGYPGSYEKGKEIKGLKDIEGIDGHVFHAGTKQSRKKLYTNGGRVLALTGRGADVTEALKNSYRLEEKVGFEGAYCRKDIGADVLDLAVIKRNSNQTIPPSCSASSVYFFCNRSQKNSPTNPNAITLMLKGELIGTKTVSKVHSINLATGGNDFLRVHGS